MPWQLSGTAPCTAKVIKSSQKPTLIIDASLHGRRIRAAVNKEDMGFYFPDDERWETIPYTAYGTCCLEDTGIMTGTAAGVIQEFMRTELESDEADWVHGLHAYYLRQRYEHHYWHNSDYNCKRTSKRMDLISFFNMMMVRDIPDGFTQWVREMLPAYFLYSGKKTDKEVSWRCSNCGHTDTMPGKKVPKFRSEYTCPHCGKTLIVRRDGMSFDDEIGVALFQRTNDKGFVERTFNARSNKTKQGAYGDPDIQESYRFFIEPDGTWYEFHHNPFRGTEKYEYWFDSSNFYSYCSNEIWEKPKRWTGNLSHELDGTIWQYSALDLFLKEMAEINKVNRYDKTVDPCSYIVKFATNPEYEYLLKAKMYPCLLEHMHGDFQFACHQGKPWQRFGLEKEEFLFMKEFNLTFGETMIARKLHTRNIGTLRETLEWFEQLEIGTTARRIHLNQDAKEALANLTHAFQGTEGVRAYLTRQAKKHKCDLKEVLDNMAQYYRTAKKLHVNMEQRLAYAPNDIMAANARLKAAQTLMADGTDWCGDLKKKDIHQKIEEIYNEIRDIYEFSDGRYCIVVPKNAADILADSYLLGQCVEKKRDEYFWKIINRDSYIFFLRHAKSPEEPFYTLETNAGSSGVIQQRTFYNSRQPNAVFFKKFGAFLDKWQAHVNEKMTEEEHQYWLKSIAYQCAQLAEYRRRHEKVHGNSADSGKQLADVLEDNYIEPMLSEEELLQQTLIKAMFTFDLTDPVPVKPDEMVRDNEAIIRTA